MQNFASLGVQQHQEILDTLGPFEWIALEAAARNYSEMVEALREERRELIINSAVDGDRLLLFKRLQKIVVTVGTFNADWFWLLVDRNHKSLTSLDISGFVRGHPEHIEIEDTQVLSGYLPHLYRCTKLEDLKMELPPPARFSTGPLAQLLFSGLRKLTITSGGWFFDDRHYRSFSECFGAIATCCDLEELSLHWGMSNTNDDEPSEEEHPHPFVPFWRAAHLTGLIALSCSGYVWSQNTMSSFTDFVNRHCSTIKRFHVLLEDHAHDVNKVLLGGLSPMQSVTEAFIPAPMIGTSPSMPDFGWVHLPLLNIPTIFPCIHYLALGFNMGYCGKRSLGAVAKELRLDYGKLFERCAHLDQILEAPQHDTFSSGKFPPGVLNALSFQCCVNTTCERRHANCAIWSKHCLGGSPQAANCATLHLREELRLACSKVLWDV